MINFAKPQVKLWLPNSMGKSMKKVHKWSLPIKKIQPFGFVFKTEMQLLPSHQIAIFFKNWTFLRVLLCEKLAHSFYQND